MLDLNNTNFFRPYTITEWIDLVFPDGPNSNTFDDDLKEINFLKLVLGNHKNWYVYDPDVSPEDPEIINHITIKSDELKYRDGDLLHWANIYEEKGYRVVEFSFNNCSMANVPPVFFVREV